MARLKNFCEPIYEIVYSGRRSPGWGTSYWKWNTISFEILNCGTATWCLQTLPKFQTNPAVCKSAETTTCQAPVCETVANKRDSSITSKLVIDDYNCLTEYFAITSEISLYSSLSVCTSPYAKCTGSATTCTSCVANYYLDGNICGLICPTHTFKDDSTWKSQPCNDPCKECSEPASKCTSCPGDLHLNADTCSLTCPADKFSSGYIKSCIPRTSPCKEGDEASWKCPSCVENHFLVSRGMFYWALWWLLCWCWFRRM